MPEFLKITLDDKKWIDQLVRAADLRYADYCFTNMYVWQDYYSLCAARIEDRLAIRLCNNTADGSSVYSFPIGFGELFPVIEQLRTDAASRGNRFVLRGIPKSKLDELKNFYPDLEFIFKRNESDYVYSAERLASLIGKKMHAKRNHINRFIVENDWSFEPITADNLHEVMEMNSEWMEQNFEEKNESYDNEKNALSRTFSNFEALELEGGVLRSGKRVIAYTIGEKLSGDTYVLHFEKAFSHIQGSYAMINREYAKHILSIHPEIVYINREEDLGLENLRKAKESYYPDFLSEKYTAVWSR